MISNDALVDFDQTLALLTQRHTEVLEKRYADIQARAAAAGLLQSGSTLKLFAQATVEELATCAIDLEKQFLEAIRSYDGVLSIADGQEAWGMMNRALAGLRDTFLMHLENHNFMKYKAAFNWPPEAALKATMLIFHQGAFQAVAQIESTFKRELAKMSKSQINNAQVVNYGTIAAVNLGENVSMPVTQNVSQEGFSVMASAIEALLEEIRSRNDVESGLKQDLLAELGELKTEALKTSPNKLRLFSGLRGVGSVISVLSDMPNAYNTLKAAALTIGVHLP